MTLPTASRLAPRANAWPSQAAMPNAVYIGTPHPFHAEQAIMHMRHGKNVLTEMPALNVSLTADEVAWLNLEM